MAHDNEKPEEPASTGKGGVYRILKSIDERLELIVKLLGYISILIITPVLFLMTYVGVDINSTLGIRTLTETERNLISELELRGWAFDEDSALIAFRRQDPIFESYLRLKMLPEEEDLVGSVWNMIASAESPSLVSEEFQFYLRSSAALRSEVEFRSQYFEELENSVYRGEFLIADQLCDHLHPVLSHGFFLFTSEKFSESRTDRCLDVAQRGDGLAYISEMVQALRGWRALIGLRDIPIFSATTLGALPRSN